MGRSRDCAPSQSAPSPRSGRARPVRYKIRYKVRYKVRYKIRYMHRSGFAGATWQNHVPRALLCGIYTAAGKRRLSCRRGHPGTCRPALIPQPAQAGAAEERLGANFKPGTQQAPNCTRKLLAAARLGVETRGNRVEAGLGGRGPQSGARRGGSLAAASRPASTRFSRAFQNGRALSHQASQADAAGNCM